MFCQYCGKECKNNRSLSAHQSLCYKNPDRRLSNLDSYNKKNVVWNKGLNKETSLSVAKNALARTKIRPEWQVRVDDDNKLYQKYLNKRINAKTEKIFFELSFEEFCMLVYEAGLISSQLGYSGNNYVLARYKDLGPYNYNNCRFITQKENCLERDQHKK